VKLEDEQYELLAKFVEAHQSTPRESRGSFIATWPHNDAEATFFHSRLNSLRFQGSLDDAEVLAHVGYLLKSFCSRNDVTFSVLPAGIDAYQEWKGSSLSDRSGSPEPEAGVDVFIAHASEDKDSIARPLHEALAARGWKVWLDEAALELGDSLRQKIDQGLRECRYGVVVLSPSFFAKTWPQRELDGLVARETASGAKAILPIWHRIDHAGVATYSPMLADRLAAKSSDGIDVVVEKVEAVLKKGAGRDGG
jgi:hypothetical protein